MSVYVKQEVVRVYIQQEVVSVYVQEVVSVYVNISVRFDALRAVTMMSAAM